MAIRGNNRPGVSGTSGSEAMVSLKSASRNRKPPKQRRFPHPFTRKVSRFGDDSENRFSSFRWCSWIGNILSGEEHPQMLFTFFLFSASHQHHRRPKTTFPLPWNWKRNEATTGNAISPSFSMLNFHFRTREGTRECVGNAAIQVQSRPLTQTPRRYNAMRMQHETSKNRKENCSTEKIGRFHFIPVNFCGTCVVSANFPPLYARRRDNEVVHNKEPPTHTLAATENFPIQFLINERNFSCFTGWRRRSEKASRLCASESIPVWHFPPLPWIIALQCHIEQNENRFYHSCKRSKRFFPIAACQIFVQHGYRFFGHHERWWQRKKLFRL